MNIARAIAKMMAEKYEQQKIDDTEIILIKNEGNTGGHCQRRHFKKDILYKIVFPTPLSSLDHYMFVCVSSYESGTFKGLTTKEQDELLTIYDEYSIHHCFFKFSRDTECSFFTNL